MKKQIKTITEINREIKSLEARQKKELAKMNSKYKKAWNSIYGMMTREEKRHPEKWKEIEKRYGAKMKKINDEWYFKGTRPIVEKYRKKLIELYADRKLAELDIKHS